MLSQPDYDDMAYFSLARAEEEAEALARIEKNLRDRPLSGFVAEGLVARGLVHDSLERAIERAAGD